MKASLIPDPQARARCRSVQLAACSHSPGPAGTRQPPPNAAERADSGPWAPPRRLAGQPIHGRRPPTKRHHQRSSTPHQHAASPTANHPATGSPAPTTTMTMTTTTNPRPNWPSNHQIQDYRQTPTAAPPPPSQRPTRPQAHQHVQRTTPSPQQKISPTPLDVVCCRSRALRGPVNEGNYSRTGAQLTSFAPGDEDIGLLRTYARPSERIEDGQAADDGMNI